MNGGPINSEVGGRFARSDELRPNARVRRREHPIFQRRPIAADRRVKSFCATFIDLIVRFADPLNIRPESGLSGLIQRQMDAESGGFGYGINEMRKRSALRAGEIAALRVIQSGN